MAVTMQNTATELVDMSPIRCDKPSSRTMSEHRARQDHIRADVEPKFSSWSKTELWQVIDVEPMPVFGKFYNG